MVFGDLYGALSFGAVHRLASTLKVKISPDWRFSALREFCQSAT
jgi:hypothetical protein